jgi:hypothetical protein
MFLIFAQTNNGKNAGSANNADAFGNIGTPYYDGLSDAQTGWDENHNDTVTLDASIFPRTNRKGRVGSGRRGKREVIKPNEIYDNNLKLNKVFDPSQYNDSYRDVMTAIVQMAPEMKSVFNLQILPVTTTVYDPEKQMPDDVVKLVYQYIKQLNALLLKMPDSVEIINDYNNYLPLTSMQYNYIKDKGIQQYYKDIGVNFNLYAETPPTSIVQFVRTLKAQREYTEEQTRYVVTFVVKKILKSVNDQMQITVYFVLKNNPAEFVNFGTYDSRINKPSQQVTLEYVYTDGFWTNAYNTELACFDGSGKKESSADVHDDNYYSFDALKQSGITDDSLIIKETNKKLRERELAKNNFTQNLAYPIYESEDLSLLTKSLYPH